MISNNKLLAALPRSDYLRLLPKLEPVTLRQNELIYECGKPIRYALFPEHGIISLQTTLDGRQTIEVASVSETGFLGVPLALGAKIHSEHALVQIEGSGFRMKADAFLSEFHRGTEFQSAVLNYTRFLLQAISRSATCNYFHQLNARLAWLFLRMHAEVGAKEFSMTHKIMSCALGAARSEIAKTAANFRRAGLIDYNRNSVRVLDRRGLEAEACPCYWLKKRECERYLGKKK